MNPSRNNAKKPLVLAITALLATPIISQAETKLDTVTVTSAGGFEQALTEAPASISVVTQKDLQTKQFRDLSEALADVEGVDVRGGTGKTGGLDISIRGMPSEYTLILIDGRRQNVAGDVTPNGFGAALTSFMPPISAIERIEVIRGPMSTLYGSDAVGGVINIITKKVNDKWGGSVGIEATIPQDSEWGSSQKTNIYASGPLIKDTLGLTVRGDIYQRRATDWILVDGGAQTGGNPAPAETKQYNIGTRLTYTPNMDHELFLDLDRSLTWYNNNDCRLGNVDGKSTGTGGGANCIGTVDPAAAPGYKDAMRVNRDQLVLGHNAYLGDGYLESSLSYAKTKTEGRTIPGKPIGNSYASYPDIIIGNDRELETRNTIFDTKYVNSYFDGHMTTLGAQYWKAEIEDGLLPQKHDQTMLAVFAENEWEIKDDLFFTLGGRYDKHDAFGGHFSPRAYLVWNTTDNLTIKGGINQGYKAPTLNQLIDGVSGITGKGSIVSIGNPDLKPEVSTNTEIGFIFDNKQGFASSITFFHNEIDDKISSSAGSCTVDWISSCSANSTADYAKNLDKAKTWGAEVSAKFNLTAKVNLALSYTWTDSEVKENGKKNGKLSDTPEHLANATLRWIPSEKSSLWLRGEYRGEARRFDGDPANLTGDDKLAYDAVGDIKSWYLLSLGGSYKLTKDLTINAGINNLLDKDFAKFKSYQDGGGNTEYIGEYFHSSRSTKGGVMPGRTFWMSANYTF